MVVDVQSVKCNKCGLISEILVDITNGRTECRYGCLYWCRLRPRCNVTAIITLCTVLTKLDYFDIFSDSVSELKFLFKFFINAYQAYKNGGFIFRKSRYISFWQSELIELRGHHQKMTQHVYFTASDVGFIQRWHGSMTPNLLRKNSPCFIHRLAKSLCIEC